MERAKPFKTMLLGVLVSSLLACASQNTYHAEIEQAEQPIKLDRQPVKIAFLPDIHFHDVYGTLSENPDFGLLVDESKEGGQQKKAVIRSMRSQLKSTRLFNENYFVFLAALEDLVKRDVKLVALPGDFSDDGQPLHIRGLVNILEYYQRRYGMRFFAIPGNHDPVRPFTIEAGKKDFLNHDGSEIAIYSSAHPYCVKGYDESIMCDDDLQASGYAEIVGAMKNFGFFPRKGDRYFETPFSRKNNNNHRFSTRVLSWCEPESNDSSACIAMPDTSYLVEPVEGLWLLAIDANVYIPKDRKKLNTDGKSYSGSSNAGYNAMLEYKPEIIGWIGEVAERARKKNKQLIAFSHFPMTDFYDQSAEKIAQIFGKGKFQLKRMPLQQTAAALADTGLKVHVGGHMHINDTGTVTSTSGSVLFNIQAPTLAAYRPAYKLMTLHSHTNIEVETIRLDKVERFDELFEFYRKERRFLAQNKRDALWDNSILDSENYLQFTDAHLRELVVGRFLPREWPADMVLLLTGRTAANLTESLQQKCSVQPKLPPHELADKAGLEMVFDFYRYRNADTIAVVSEQRKSFYLALSHSLTGCELQGKWQKLKTLFEVLALQINSQPADHIMLDLDTNTIRELN